MSKRIICLLTILVSFFSCFEHLAVLAEANYEIGDDKNKRSLVWFLSFVMAFILVSCASVIPDAPSASPLPSSSADNKEITPASVIVIPPTPTPVPHISAENVAEDGGLKKGGDYHSVQLAGLPVILMIEDNSLVCINTSKEESLMIKEINDPKEIYWGASFGGEDSIYVLTGNKELYSLSFLYRDHTILTESEKILENVSSVDVKEITEIIETAQGN